MPRFTFGVLVVLSLIVPSLSAQTDAVVGVPYTFDFGQGLKDIPIPPEISFSYSFTVSGGSLPPGLTLKSNGLMSGTPTAAGQFTFNVRWNFVISAFGQSVNFDQSFPYTITVTGSSGPKLSVQPGGLSFTFTTGAAANTQYISVNNQGDAPRDFSAAVTTGSNWLSVSGGGTAGAFAQGSAAVTANPAGLPAGTYVGSVAITFAAGGERFDVPVVLSISSAQQSLNLSQTGLTFRAVAGGAAPPAQSFSVLNAGGGALDWTVATSTLSGGAAWLTATPAAGRSDASSAPAIQVQVRPAGLAAGDYYGQVKVSAAGVANSPQSLSVVLTVLPSNAALAPVVAPTGLIFVGQAGGANPPAQPVDITNLASSPVNVSTGTLLEQGTGWLNVTPKTGAAPSGQPLRIQVQPALAGLAAGVYRGEVDLLLTPGNTTRRIDVLLIVVPGGGAPAKSDGLGGGRFAGGCTPAKLLPVFTQLGSSFTTIASWPTPVELRVVDDCGTAMTTGAVVLTFSSGDPLLAMTNLRDGRWTATWQARTSGSTPVTITAKAQQASPSLAGTASIGGSLQPNPTAPVIAAGGAVSAVSNVPLAPLAPGSLVRISGANLAQGSSQSSEVPLAKQLNGTQVLLAGLAMPLQSASDGQIVAVVPFDVPINATQQIIVQRAASYSVPEPVPVAAAQPAVYTKDPSGKGAALAAGIKPDGTQFVVDADNPVTAGDTLVISCAGLGAVDPALDAGAAGPESPVSNTVNPVTVTIGGVDATVSSAVLAPDLVGVYQVTVTVPDGVTAAPDAALVVTVAGQASPAVTVAVQ